MPELIPYLKDKKYGYSNPQGKLLIEPKFTRAVFFDGPSALVEIKDKDSMRQVIINRKGEVVFSHSIKQPMKLLPGGQYFTIGGSFKSEKGPACKIRLFNSKGIFLKEFEGSDQLHLDFVSDSVVFYSDGKSDKPYSVYDLSGKREISPGKYIRINDSVLLHAKGDGYKLLRQRTHAFVLDPALAVFTVTAFTGGLLVVRDDKGVHGIADVSGRIIVIPAYKDIALPKTSLDKTVVCRRSNGNLDEYTIAGNHLVTNRAQTKTARYSLVYSKSRSAYAVKFGNGHITDTLYNNSSITYTDSHHLIVGIKPGKQAGPETFSLLDTLGHVIIDRFVGTYCGNGIYLVQGANGRSAFWKSGKYISPFIYSQYVHNKTNFTTPPPVNIVIDSCMITNVLNRGNNAFGLISTSGKDILNPIYHYVNPVGNGLYFVSGNNGMFYCNSAGIIYASGIGSE